MGLARMSWNSVRVFSKLFTGLLKVLYDGTRFGTGRRIAYAHSNAGARETTLLRQGHIARARARSPRFHSVVSRKFARRNRDPSLNFTRGVLSSPVTRYGGLASVGLLRR